jgi:hypothetical protein
VSGATGTERDPLHLLFAVPDSAFTASVLPFFYQKAIGLLPEGRDSCIFWWRAHLVKNYPLRAEKPRRPSARRLRRLVVSTFE